MSAKDYVAILDWSSAIASATMELNNSNNVEENYLYRGIARCFINGKDSKHPEAIEDLSNAIIRYVSSPNHATHPYINYFIALYYRAYTYYLDSNYQKAIEDCEKICVNCKKASGGCMGTNGENLCACAFELLGKIYFAMNSYEKAVQNFSEAMTHYSTQVISSYLSENYREACKRMNNP